MRIKLSLFLGLLFFSGCLDLKNKPSPLTSTGNPCLPGSTCSLTPGVVEGNTYTNKLLEVEVTFPSGWGVEEKNITTDSMDVIFSGPEEENRTSAIGKLSRLTSEPVALEAHVQQEFPTLTVTPVSVQNISGLTFDDPNPGSNGGDAKRFFFLYKTTFLDLTAEIFPQRIAEAQALLDGIRFLQ